MVLICSVWPFSLRLFAGGVFVGCRWSENNVPMGFLLDFGGFCRYNILRKAAGQRQAVAHHLERRWCVCE